MTSVNDVLAKNISISAAVDQLVDLEPEPIEELLELVQDHHARDSFRVIALIYLAPEISVIDPLPDSVADAFAQICIRVLGANDALINAAPAVIDAIAVTPDAFAERVAKTVFASELGSRFQLLRACRTKGFLELVKSDLAQIPRSIHAVANAQFRQAFTDDDMDVLLELYDTEHPSALMFCHAFSKMSDPRAAEALWAAAELKGVRTFVFKALRSNQAAAETVVGQGLLARKKSQRAIAVEIVEKWELTPTLTGAIQTALEKEKTADLKERLSRLLPTAEASVAGFEKFFSEIDENTREYIAEDLNALASDEEVTWEKYDPNVLLVTAVRAFKGAPGGSELVLELFHKLAVAVGEATWAPVASARMLPELRQLYNKAKPIGPVKERWGSFHTRYGSSGVQAVIDLFETMDVDPWDVAPWIIENAPERYVELLEHDEARKRETLVTIGSRWAEDDPALVVNCVGAAIDHKKQDVRIAVIDILSNSSAEAVPLLEARFKKERGKKAKAAITRALTELAVSGAPDLDTMAETEDAHAELDAYFAAIIGEPTFPYLDLPRLHWASGAACSDGAFRWVLTTLEQHTDREINPTLISLRRHVEPVSAKRLLEALRENFEGTDEARIGWVLFASVLLATDNQLLALGGDLDQIARFGSSTEAFRRLEVLARVASSPAVGRIEHWSRKAKSDGLKDRAKSAFRFIANQRGISPEALADQLLDDFGLDENGERMFEFCGRSVVAKFKHADVGIVDEHKIKPRFPGQRKADDPIEYEAVRDEYRAWRKAVKAAVKGQIARLESAMLWGREWTRDQFIETFGDHPILRDIAANTLWLVSDGSNECVARFDDEGTFANVDDEAVPFDVLHVSVAHTSHIKNVDAWRQQFIDYFIVPAFDQLDRVVGQLDSSDLIETSITIDDVDERTLNKLRNFGWSRGPVEDAGLFHSYDQSFPNDLYGTVSLSHGVSIGYDSEGTQSVTLEFRRSPGVPVVLGRVPGGLVSDLLGLLQN